jgi:hypothetical protein
VGIHLHRICRCGATWLERSAGHAHVDISLDDPAFVACAGILSVSGQHLSGRERNPPPIGLAGVARFGFPESEFLFSAPPGWRFL